MILAWMLLLATLPRDDVQRDTVCLVERNHHHDDDCRKVFTQYIFWDFEGTRHQVAGWRLEKDGFRFTERPPTVTWTEEGRLYQVKGSCWRETWSQGGADPEIEERGVLPRESRRGLFGRRE